MLHTIINLNDVFRQGEYPPQGNRSSNPYDYIRTGYFIDNASMFGGCNNVDFNCNSAGNSAGINLYIPGK